MVYEKLNKDRILARQIAKANTTPGIINNMPIILKAIMRDSFELWLWNGHLELALKCPMGVYHLALKA